ncbi:MAG: aminoacyl-tRNA hydrolase [Thermoleophilia bacterium]
MAFFSKDRGGAGGMTLLVGLGNPGEEYAGSRHNAGFMTAALIMRRHDLGRGRQRYGGRWCEGRIRGNPVAVLMPQTFMNRSGDAVAEAAGKKHIALERIVVIHDDLDFPFGVVRCRQGGGSGGHNGLASIIDRLGTDRFIRVRVGIGRPDDPEVQTSDWVLSGFDRTAEELAAVTEQAADCAEAVVTRGVEAAMASCNRRDAEA